MDEHARPSSSYVVVLEAPVEDILDILDDYDNPDRGCGCCAPVAKDDAGRKYYAPGHMFGR